SGGWREAARVASSRGGAVRGEAVSGGAGASRSAARGACDACLRRAWLVARLAGRIELARHEHARLPEVLALSDGRLIAAVGGAVAARVAAEYEHFDAAAARDAVEAAELVAICRHDERFPSRLLHARDAPAVLHVAGDARLLEVFAAEEPAAAIVGMRRASPYGKDVARALARDLAAAGVPVVSGMALGVDSAAHAGALDAGGLTVAVLAGGADVPYPPSKRHLHDEIRRRGLVVSELPPGFRARKWCFPARNRIIAGLADLTIVVEAAERSGSLITADLAAKLGREVAAAPGPITSPGAAGTNALLRDGATLVRNARDVLDALFGVGNAPAQARRVGTLEPPLKALLDAVAHGRDTVAALAGASADKADAALVGLTELELRGLVRREPGGRYAVVP
ncbi:MAG TPA: DNA-processing protein DprA, partial [Solirubrobacteraceae bacterium]|nr:DNA-processing protein DprA [Solirubrobacteraceae bacterium]